MLAERDGDHVITLVTKAVCVMMSMMTTVSVTALTRTGGCDRRGQRNDDDDDADLADQCADDD